MGFILSCATTPSRIEKLIDIIPKIRRGYKFFVINICSEYRRFGKFKMPKSLLQLCRKNKKVVFNFENDYGPLTKYIGGFNFMTKRKLENDRLIILDDDICYQNDLFYELIDEKTSRNITGGSGFNFYLNRDYTPIEGDCDFLEGYGAICFDYNQRNDFMFWLGNMYRHFDFNGDDIVDKYICACFLGDDFVISNCYDNCFAVRGCRNYLAPQQYGFGSDALHKNNVFGSNMGTYDFLDKNSDILNQLKNKYQLNREIRGELDEPQTDKIRVITWYDDNIREYADITADINQGYCESSNIDWLVDTVRRCPERHPAWEGLFAVYNQLLTTDYDYIVWIDSDAVFRNNQSIQDIINDYREFDFLISYDYPYTFNLNTGLYIVKNNQKMRDLFKGITETENKKYYHKIFWDQSHLQELYNRNFMKIRESICILSHRKIQDFYDVNPKALILHLAGTDKKTRVDKFTKIRDGLKS